ncbi:MAG: hypothetical protein QM775_21345 [Pirellulales bacterium]
MNDFVLDFSTVSREIRSIVARRRELLIFLGSLFAAMSLFLQKVLDGELPESFRGLQHHIFALHAVLVLVPCVIIVLRIAKLHAGMTINGVFYSHMEKSLGRPAMPWRAAKLNLFGVSAAMVYLVDMLAAGEAAILTLALGYRWPIALGIGFLIGLVGLLMFARFHRMAGEFALKAIEGAKIEPLTLEELEEHWAESRSDSNHDLIALNGFAGLMLFSTLENIVGFGRIGVDDADLSATAVQSFGPQIYGGLLVAAYLFVLMMYLRLAVAIAKFSLQLDPTDQPYRPTKLTDTLLGYAIVSFFFMVAVQLCCVPWFTPGSRTPWIVGIVAGVIALAAYPISLAVAGHNQRKRAAAANSR